MCFTYKLQNKIEWVKCYNHIVYSNHMYMSETYCYYFNYKM